MKEVLLGVKQFPQPSPKKNPGGDCFACALKAVVDHFYPDDPIPFDDAWNAWMRESMGGGKVLSNVWPTLHSAIYSLPDRYRLEREYDLPIGSVNIERYSHAWGLGISSTDWAHRMEAWLSAGWVAMIEMELEGHGPMRGEYVNHTDHFAVVDGIRHYWKPHDHVQGAATLMHDAHVVCSARGSSWKEVGNLIWKHGVAGLFLVRRRWD